MTNLSKENLSPFATAALALDAELSQFDRIAREVESLAIQSDKGLERGQKLLIQFDECRERISTRMLELGTELENARQRMDTATQAVVVQANAVHERQQEASRMLERFRGLGNMVREVTASVGELYKAPGGQLSEQEQAELATHLSGFNSRLENLIKEARDLMKDAHTSNMKTLERSADSLRQSLQTASNRLNLFVDRHAPQIRTH